MSDFDALVKINIDDSELTNVEQRLQTLNGMKIPVDIDLSKAASSIQSQLNQIANGMKLQITNISLGNGANNSAQKLGQQAGRTFSNAFVNNINVSATANEISKLQSALKLDFNFDDTSIKNVTQNLNDMDVAIKSITTKLNGKNIDLNIEGVDQLGNAVTVVKSFETATGSLVSSSTKIKQTFEDVSKVANSAAQWQAKLESLKTTFKSVLDIGTTSTNSLKKALDGIDFTNISNSADLDAMVTKFKAAQAEAERLNSLLNKKWATTAIEQIEKSIKDLPTAFVLVEEKFKSLGTLGDEFDKSGKSIRDTIETLKTSLEGLDTIDNPETKIKAYNQIADTLDRLQNIITETTAKQKNMFTDNDIASYTTKLDELESNFKKLGTAGEESVAKIQELRNEISQLGTSDGSETQINKYREIGTQIDNLGYKYKSLSTNINSAASSQNLLTQKATLGNRFQNWLNSNTKATKVYKEEIEELKAAIESIDSTTAYNTVSKQISQFETMAKAAGNAGNSWYTTLFGNITKLSPLFGMGTLVNSGISALKSMYNNVVDIDTAMTELKKVTDETAESYDSFLEGIGDTAQEIGTTVSDLIESTADFARLGYDMDDAEYLAEVANIYYVVGDEISDIDEATDSIISTMTAFGVEASNALSIVDKLNEVSNNYAISSGGLGDALSRSASSMAAANNTLDETIALITAALNLGLRVQKCTCGTRLIALIA